MMNDDYNKGLDLFPRPDLIYLREFMQCIHNLGKE